MIANAPGTVNDIVDEQYRALAFSIWSIGPMNGPVTGPLIGGFAAEYLGWRWTNWLVIIFSGVGWVMCSLIKETYAPVLLQRKAAKIREETGDDRWWSRYDQKLSSKSFSKPNNVSGYLTFGHSPPDSQSQPFQAVCSSIHRTHIVVLECLHISTYC